MPINDAQGGITVGVASKGAQCYARPCCIVLLQSGVTVIGIWEHTYLSLRHTPSVLRHLIGVGC